MKLVFAGTPDFAVPTLQLLLQSDLEIVAVYTRPDRPAGRGRKLTASPVKQLAQSHHLLVSQPESFRDAGAISQLASLQPDIMVVVAYGLILPPAVLEIPTHGCLNVHASLLPRWRGAAPIQRAILAGDQQTGITIMQMEAGLDTGDILKQSRIPITADTSAQELHDQLAIRGAADLLKVVDQFSNGAPPKPQKQDENMATYAEKLSKEEAEIDWGMPAEQILRKIKAFNPWPVAYTRLNGKSLRIWDAGLALSTQAPEPGRLLSVDNGLPVVSCGEGAIGLLEVQPEGKKRMTSQAFMNARKADVRPGIVMGR